MTTTNHPLRIPAGDLRPGQRIVTIYGDVAAVTGLRKYGRNGVEVTAGEDVAWYCVRDLVEIARER